MKTQKLFYTNPHEGLPDLPKGVQQRVGSHQGARKKVGIVAARFNIHLTGALVSTAVDTLIAHGVQAEDISVSWVPGSFEIPLALKRLSTTTSFDALIACGVVLQGKTLHAELIMRSLTHCFQQLSLELNCPVIDAVVSADTPKQAEDRCLNGSESRGAYAALAALECSG
jgi:6,7-dimethyl-8-ribityllumazine synthase